MRQGLGFLNPSDLTSRKCSTNGVIITLVEMSGWGLRKDYATQPLGLLGICVHTPLNLAQRHSFPSPFAQPEVGSGREARGGRWGGSQGCGHWHQRGSGAGPVCAWQSLPSAMRWIFSGERKLSSQFETETRKEKKTHTHKDLDTHTTKTKGSLSRSCRAALPRLSLLWEGGWVRAKEEGAARGQGTEGGEEGGGPRADRIGAST